MTVAGVDGCPGGWAVVRLCPTDSQSAENGVVLIADRVVDLTRLLEETRQSSLSALAIDMPIGLLDTHPRLADVAARSLLGSRRSSVFPTPLRATLDAADYDDACRRSRTLSGKALSRQAWNLVPKIRELDALLGPDDQSRIVEAHPECGFVRLNDGPLEHPKASPEGRALRLRLLEAALGSDAVVSLVESGAAPLVDLIDAAVNAVTARHVAAGTEIRLGGDLDPTGLRAEIVY